MKCGTLFWLPHQKMWCLLLVVLTRGHVGERNYPDVGNRTYAGCPCSSHASLRDKTTYRGELLPIRSTWPPMTMTPGHRPNGLKIVFALPPLLTKQVHFLVLISLICCGWRISTILSPVCFPAGMFSSELTIHLSR